MVFSIFGSLTHSDIIIRWWLCMTHSNLRMDGPKIGKAPRTVKTQFGVEGRFSFQTTPSVNYTKGWLDGEEMYPLGYTRVQHESLFQLRDKNENFSYWMSHIETRQEFLTLNLGHQVTAGRSRPSFQDLSRPICVLRCSQKLTLFHIASLNRRPGVDRGRPEVDLVSTVWPPDLPKVRWCPYLSPKNGCF